MSTLDKLKQFAPPPTTSILPGSAEAWKDLENRWSIIFPTDYKDLIGCYGAGQFADFFGIKNPFFLKWGTYEEWVGRVLEGINGAQKSYPECATQFPVYPAVNGLFPCGYTDNGGTIYWLMNGAPDNWPIVCLDGGCSKESDRFDVSLTEFIWAWLNGKINVRSLTPPDFFPLPRPVFVPYAK